MLPLGFFLISISIARWYFIDNDCKTFLVDIFKLFHTDWPSIKVVNPDNLAFGEISKHKKEIIEGLIGLKEVSEWGFILEEPTSTEANCCFLLLVNWYFFLLFASTIGSLPKIDESLSNSFTSSSFLLYFDLFIKKPFL